MVGKIFVMPLSQLCSLPAVLPEGKQAPKPLAAGPASTAAESHLEEFLVPWQGKGLEHGEEEKLPRCDQRPEMCFISFYQLSIPMNKQLALRMFHLYDTGAGTGKGRTALRQMMLFSANSDKHLF